MWFISLFLSLSLLLAAPPAIDYFVLVVFLVTNSPTFAPVVAFFVLIVHAAKMCSYTVPQLPSFRLPQKALHTPSCLRNIHLRIHHLHPLMLIRLLQRRRQVHPPSHQIPQLSLRCRLNKPIYPFRFIFLSGGNSWDNCRSSWMQATFTNGHRSQI